MFSDAVLVGRRAGQHVQMPVVHVGQRGRLLPVPVGGVRLGHLGGVTLQGLDPADDAGVRQPCGLVLAVQQRGGLRAAADRGQFRPLGAEHGLLAQRQGDVPLLAGQGRAGGRPVEYVGPADGGGQ